LFSLSLLFVKQKIVAHINARFSRSQVTVCVCKCAYMKKTTIVVYCDKFILWNISITSC